MRAKTGISVQFDLLNADTEVIGKMQRTLTELAKAVEVEITLTDHQRLVWNFFLHQEGALVGEVALVERRYLVDGFQVRPTSMAPVLVMLKTVPNLHVASDGSIGSKWGKSTTDIRGVALQIVGKLCPAV